MDYATGGERDAILVAVLAAHVFYDAWLVKP